MDRHPDAEYFSELQMREMNAAAATTNRAARAIHIDLAKRYGEKARKLDAATPGKSLRDQ